MELHLILHILQNPSGKSDQQIKEARLATVDWVEKFWPFPISARPKHLKYLLSKDRKDSLEKKNTWRTRRNKTRQEKWPKNKRGSLIWKEN